MRRARLILLTLLLIPALAFAERATWFKVELIAFERLGRSDTNSELWPANPGGPDWSRAVSLRPTGTGPAGSPAPFERLSRNDYELGPHMWSLSRDRSGVRPLIHRAWVQPIGSRKGAAAVYLKSSGSVDLEDDAPDSGRTGAPPMEGTLTLSRNRYLHADLDLLLRRADGVDPVSGTAARRTYRLHAQRRMRSGELHYIDHPAMGVLIKVTPFGPAQPTMDDEPPETPDQPGD